MAILIISCALLLGACGSDNRGPAPPVTIGYADIPELDCSGQKSYTQIVVDLNHNGTISGNHYCWVNAWGTNYLGNPDGECLYSQFFSNTQQLSFSLALPDGEYKVGIGLTDDQFNAQNCLAGPSYITYFPSQPLKVGQRYCPQMKMRIEYDCMINNDIRNSNFKQRLENVFDPGSHSPKSIRIDPDQTSLTESILIGRPQVMSFIQINWVNGHQNGTTNANMYLAGITDVTDKSWMGPATGTILGVTIGSYITSQVGDEGASTLMFNQLINNHFGQSPYNYGTSQVEEVINRVATHELGHQRAALTHPSEQPSLHDSNKDCVMDWIKTDPYNNYSLLGSTTFCSKCQANLNAISW